MMDLLNEVNISDYAEHSYLEYAMSVVKGRAIASVQDGCKPVHRRIIYSMYKMGISDSVPPVKCARVTGDVIGKYHPHGDMAVYESMVNMAQPFRMRYPVIEGVGNFGSRDGDGAAAARYTECKFYPLAKIFVDELNENAVDFIPNYDGKDVEPKFLPVRLPMILLNTTEGIGVGMATYIPSHNTTEVINAVIAYLNNKSISIKELLEHIKGPDFPTGGMIISSKDEIEKIYTEGRGSFRMRAKYFIENAGTKNWKIVFNELPYGISVKTVLEEIFDLLNPEIKAKKDAKGKPKISQEQLRLKQLFFNLIADYRDDSDKENPLRLVITPKTFRQNSEELVEILLSSTSLESNFSSNFVLVGIDNRPCQKNLFEIISEWSEFRLETIERRCKFYIEKIAARMHILEGRKIILNHIDEVIKIVKNSEDIKTDLMNKFGLSEIQAIDVMDLKLRQLGNLEIITIEKEYKEISGKKSELEKIISSEKTLKKQMIKELSEDLVKYGDKRLTEIVESQKSDLSLLHEKSAKIAEEDITLAVSEKGWVKSYRGKKEISEISFKEGDLVAYKFDCKNTDLLAIFDVDGKVYNAALNGLPKDGCPIATLGQIGAKIALVCPINKDFKYVLAQDSGFGFIVNGENLITRMKAGKEMITVVKNGKILQPLYFHGSEDKSNYFVGVITTENRVLIYHLNEISEIGKGKGVVICGLNEQFKIKELKLIKGKSVSFKASGKKKTEHVVLDGEEFDRFIKGRATKGGFLPIRDKMSEINFE
jgi:topoisomerase-4 subunit A